MDLKGKGARSKKEFEREKTTLPNQEAGKLGVCIGALGVLSVILSLSAKPVGRRTGRRFSH